MSATVRVVCRKCSGTGKQYSEATMRACFGGAESPACVGSNGGCGGRGYNFRELHPSDPLAAPLVDTERLNWLDAQRQDMVERGSDGDPELIGCEWTVRAQAYDVRTAIDNEILATRAPADAPRTGEMKDG